MIETMGAITAYRAIAIYRPDGYPIIYYGPAYTRLSPLMQRFVRLHECAHLVEPTLNEFLANCRALQVMRRQGLTRRNEDLIAQSHYRDGTLPAQYGGSGALFWGRTIACAGRRAR